MSLPSPVSPSATKRTTDGAPAWPLPASPLPPAPAAPAPAAPAAPAAPPLEDPPESEDPVLAVDEAQWQLETSRPARLQLVGWMISGEALVGNHKGAQVIIPEVRAFPEQAFMTLDYFRVFVRGRKGRVDLLQEGEARIEVGGESPTTTEALDGARLYVVRRDANLDPDFDVGLSLVDETLPDPRARLLQVDLSERLVEALFTLGFPLRAERRVRLGPLVLTVRFDGEKLRISDYLASYRPEGAAFRPFFHREAGKGFRTFPEDGAPIELAPGDAIIAGLAVYAFRRA